MSAVPDKWSSSEVKTILNVKPIWKKKAVFLNAYKIGQENALFLIASTSYASFFLLQYPEFTANTATPPMPVTVHSHLTTHWMRLQFSILAY